MNIKIIIDICNCNITENFREFMRTWMWRIPKECRWGQPFYFEGHSLCGMSLIHLQREVSLLFFFTPFCSFIFTECRFAPFFEPSAPFFLWKYPGLESPVCSPLATFLHQYTILIIHWPPLLLFSSPFCPFISYYDLDSNSPVVPSFFQVWLW